MNTERVLGMADQLMMSVPGKPEYVGTVRIAVAHVASNAGFDIEAIDDIKIAVSEACTNIINHAHKCPEFSYDVILEVGEEGLTITVKDFGIGFNVENSTKPVSGEPQESGLGLFIIKALMDEVSINSAPGHGADIKMTRYLPDKIA